MRLRLATGLLLATIVAAGMPARAQAPSVDTLLARLFGSEDKTPYELTADFAGTLNLVVRGSTIAVVAAGSFVESRGADGVKRRRVQITRMDLPVLLRPFRGTIRRIIEEKIEAQADAPQALYEHDIFIQGELPGRRYALVGVHGAIVDETIDHFGRPEDKRNVEVRRRIARWLYTTPGRRETIVRPGPPYALRVIMDEAGTLYELTLFYDWGEVSTRINYVLLNGQPVWRQVLADAVSELPGVGRVDGKLNLTFSNHCVNCKKP